MVGGLICVAAVALGIDVGWQRLPEGGMEYLIQLEPEVLDTLRDGGVIQSDIPPSLGTIRAYRISVGEAELPRELPPPAETGPAETQPPADGPLEPSAGALPPQTPASSPDLPWPSLGNVGPQPEEPADAADPPALPEAASVFGQPLPSRPSAARQPPPSSSPPQFLPEEPQRKPLEAEPAVFHSPAVDSSESGAGNNANDSEAEQEKPKPWAPLLVTLFGLFASMGGNLYLGWLALDFRGRYRGLLRRQAETVG